LDKTLTGGVYLVQNGKYLVTPMNTLFPTCVSHMIMHDSGQLFVNYKFKKTVGKRGKGPGEYSSIFDFTVNGDTVFLFDRRMSKIVAYSLETDQVIDEIVNKDLSQFYGFLRKDGKFYLAFARYTPDTEPNKSLLFTLDREKKLRELSFRYADLGHDKIMFKYPPMALVLMKDGGNVLYIRFPFSNRMWIYDVVRDSVESFKLDLEYPQQKDLSRLRDLQDQMKASEHIEVVSAFFLLDDLIAFWSVVPKFNEAPTRARSQLRFYTYAGKKVAQFNVDPFLFDVQDSLFARWEVDTAHQSVPQYPYRIVWEKYRIN
jgi:hypothetical protein